MEQKLPITAIIMTYNEERNLPDCLDSIKDFAGEIIVVDSFSTDRTIEIASKCAAIYKNRFINQAKQFNWALENARIRNDWVLRVDADERWTPEGFYELRNIIENDSADGVYVKIKIYFMDRWMRHGDFYPNLFMRAFKWKKSRLEERWMDEHVIVDGKTIVSGIDVIEKNHDRQKDIALWTAKHNSYSTREAVEHLLSRHNLNSPETIAKLGGNKTERKRWFKENLYSIVPLFARPFLYFFYRYFLKLGFLDGKEGFIFHTLHAFWYRFLVDAKIYQIEKLAAKEKTCIKAFIRNVLGIEP